MKPQNAKDRRAFNLETVWPLARTAGIAVTCSKPTNLANNPDLLDDERCIVPLDQSGHHGESGGGAGGQGAAVD